jgi:hypothetical protein
MECSLIHWYDLKNDAGQVTGHVILGRIQMFQAVSRVSSTNADKQKDFIFDKQDRLKVLPEKLRAVSRLGGVT